MAAVTNGLSERTAWARNLAAPLRDFLNTQSAGAVALLGAAVNGIAARRRSRSAPTSSSRLASSPTTRKKNVIRPESTQ